MDVFQALVLSENLLIPRMSGMNKPIIITKPRGAPGNSGTPVVGGEQAKTLVGTVTVDVTGIVSVVVIVDVEVEVMGIV